MKIVLHILIKDLRRHRMEIAAYFLACAAWAWQQTHPQTWMWLRQRELLAILLFGLWFFIVVRAIQGECLVGDREFWPTRPYQWGQLMAAKAILLGLCLHGPLLAAQLYFLSTAGIPLSWSLAPGILFLQGWFALFLTFPAAVLASITETIVQWVLALAGLLLYGLILSWLPWPKLPSPLGGGENVAAILGVAIVTPALAFALLWQYARRRVWPARLAAGGAMLSIPVVILIAPTPMVRSIAYPYPKDGASFGVSIPESPENHKREYLRFGGAYTEDIEIPITAEGLDSSTIVSVDGFRVSLSGDHGWHWTSEWQNRYFKLSPEDRAGGLRFTLPAKLADQMADAHLTAKVDLAFGLIRLERPVRVETGSDRFTIAGAVFCRWFHPQARDPLNSSGDEVVFIRPIACAAPLRLPPVLVWQIVSGDSTCPHNDTEPPLPAGLHASDSEYGSDTPGPDFDVNPVRNLNLSFGDWEPPIKSVQNPNENRKAQFCRGTPLFVRSGTYQRKLRATFDLGSIGEEKRLNDSEQQSVRFDPSKE